MPSADQVPVKSPHSTMHWHMWVVLIAGLTGSALRAVRPPNLHITPDESQRDLYYAASATGSLYRSPLAIMAQAILAILLASATAACLLIPPSLSLPPLECCFGTSPIQAEKSLPDRNALGSATLATRAVASAGPTPGISSSRLLVSLDRCQALIMRSNSRICALSIRSRAPRAATHSRAASGKRSSS